MVPTPHSNLGSLPLPPKFWGIFEILAKVARGSGPNQIIVAHVEKLLFFSWIMLGIEIPGVIPKPEF